MKLEFKTRNQKQLDAVTAWLDNDVEEILFGGGKGGCFTKDTLVHTSKGLRHINKIKRGDFVHSFNVGTKTTELKEVLDTFVYGCDTQSSMLQFNLVNGLKINCTNTHEFYFEGIWQPAHRIAERAMEVREGHKQSLSNLGQRKVNDNPLEKLERTFDNETSDGLQGLYGNDDLGCGEIKKCKHPQISSDSIPRESVKQVASESYRLQPTEQQCREFGVGNTERERRTFFKGGAIKRFFSWLQTKEPLSRFKGMERKINRGGCNRDTQEIQAESLYKRNVSKGIWSKTEYNKRRNTKKLEAREITLSEIKSVYTYHQDEDVYDLNVEGNNNYILSDGIIVHNSKSYTGASLIFGDALIYPETHYFIARKELIDLRKFTIPTIHEVFKMWGLKIDDYAKLNGQDNVFTLYNGSKVFLIACNEIPSDPLYERFGSMQMTRGWIEEAGEVAEAAKANLWLATGRWKNDVYKLKKKMLITCNPKKGWMKRDFIDPWKQNLLPKNRRFIQALATDNPYLPADYVNSLRNEKDPVRRQRLFLGDWDYDEDKDSLISFDALSDTFSNTINKENQKYLVVDVARFGRDSTVFSFWNGLELYKVEKFQEQSTDKTKQQIRDFAAAEKIPYSNIGIDEVGVGGGVIDGLMGVKGFIANSTPIPTASQIRAKNIGRITEQTKTNFKNLNAQCAFKLAELINEHKIAFKVPEYREEIIEDLTAQLRHKNVDSDGKLAIKSKDEVKEDIGHSPDLGDCIIQRMAFELKKEMINEDPNNAVQQAQISQFEKNRTNFLSNSTR